MTTRSNLEDHCDAPFAASAPRRIVSESLEAPNERSAVRRRSSGVHVGLRYFGHALRNPYHLVLLAAALLFSAITWSFMSILLTMSAEALFLGFVPSRRFFRRLVDADLERKERLLTAKAREELVLQMASEHRQELARLDVLVQKTYENVGRQQSAVALVVDGGLDLSRLTTSYIRIAVAYKTSYDLLAMTNRPALEETIRSLEAAQLTAADRMRVLLLRRLSIARKRAECWGRIGHTLEVTSQQLATVAELIHLLHEQSMAPADSRRMRDEIDQFMRDIEDSEGAMREIAEIGADDPRDPPDVEVRSARSATRLGDPSTRGRGHGMPTVQSVGRIGQINGKTNGAGQARAFR
jgi:hypothetical protein